MQSFMSRLNDSQRKVYQKVAFISSLHQQVFNTSKYSPISKSSKFQTSLNHQDLFNICKYSNPLIAPIPQNIQQKIDHQKFTEQQNSCLHVAAEYGNVHMVRHLVRHYNNLNPALIESDFERRKSVSNEKVNERNRNGDTALIHCVKTNEGEKMEKMVTFLSNYSDLKVRDRNNKLVFELDLPVYSVSRVRVLDILKERYLNTCH